MMIQTADFELISKLVHDRSGIVLAPGKEYLVESRLRPLARQEGLDTLEALSERLRSGARQLVEKVVDALTTNETSFFRDMRPFDALRENILPALIETRRKDKVLNIWCAASSSGQEPFSLVMLLLEHFPELVGWDVRFVATDISESMLERCRAGIYSQLEVSRGLPARMLTAYFEKADTKWKLRERVHKMVKFHQLNLTEPFPAAMGQIDLVMIRNVLIYFDAATKDKIFKKIHQVMRPNGCMMLGTAETASGDAFLRVPCGPISYYRKVA